MSEPSCIILYVTDPAQSVAFYTQLLEKTPVESCANFAMFVLASGSTLGLWAKHDVQPASSVTGGGGELGFTLSDKAAVDALYQRWLDLGIQIIQTPTEMDFGYTFTAVDPDGHRLRVFSLV